MAGPLIPPPGGDTGRRRQKIFLPRAEETLSPLADIVRDAGLVPVCFPLYSAERLADTRLPPLSGRDVLIFTSVHGAESFAALSGRRGNVVFCVGPQTAEAAARLGFSDIRGHSSARDAAGLAGLLARESAQLPPNARLYHFCGEDRQALPGIPGREVRQIPLYKAALAPGLPEDIRSDFAEGAYMAALLFSARTAAHFETLLAARESTSPLPTSLAGANLASTKILCLSQTVVESLGSLQWHDVRVAPTPDRAGMTRILLELLLKPLGERRGKAAD